MFTKLTICVSPRVGCDWVGWLSYCGRGWWCCITSDAVKECPVVPHPTCGIAGISQVPFEG